MHNLTIEERIKLYEICIDRKLTDRERRIADYFFIDGVSIAEKLSANL